MIRDGILERNKAKKMIVVTGGAGYIGRHVSEELIRNEKSIKVIDNLENSCIETINRIENIANEKKVRFRFYKGDIRDMALCREVLTNCEAVIHLAAQKSVPESKNYSTKYWDVNVGGTINIIKAMEETCCKRIIFSSTAAVYSEKEANPVTEKSQIKPSSVYGETKLTSEKIIESACNSGKIQALVLRYFNPAGCSTRMGVEDCREKSNNSLFNAIGMSLLKNEKHLEIYGNDWNTADGTAIRDYIHVSDIARAHVNALKRLESDGLNYLILNLGSGQGFTVMDVIKSFEKVTGKEIKWKLKKRRDGDIGVSIADAGKARKEIDWKAERKLIDICKDHMEGMEELLKANNNCRQ